MRVCNALALLFIADNRILKGTEIYSNSPFVPNGLDFAQGLAIGLLIVALILLTRFGVRLRNFNHRILNKNSELTDEK